MIVQHICKEKMWGISPYGKLRIRMKTLDKVKPPTDTETVSEISLEKEPCVPLPEVVKEIKGANSSATGDHVNEAVTWWRTLPRARQILFEFVGETVVACLTMAAVARLIARIFERRK
jgi:hypothetical protein